MPLLPEKPFAASAWMLTGSLVFSFMGFFTTLLSDQVSWQVVALARSALAFAFALILALLARARLVLHDSWFLWQRSIAGSISLVCTFHALTNLPLSEVLMVTNTYPVWLAMISWPMLGDKPGWQVWVSALLGVTGVALVKQPWAGEGWSLDWLPLLTSFIAAWATAFAMIGLNQLKHLDTRSVVVHFSGVACVFSSVALLFLPTQFQAANALEGSAPWLLLGVGLTATAGQICLTKAFTGGRAAVVSVIGLSQVLFGALLEGIWTGRWLNPLGWTGLALVTFSTGWVLLRQGYFQRQSAAKPELASPGQN
jgi:drug/metabolite transporter (DMT)-like permease